MYIEASSEMKRQQEVAKIRVEKLAITFVEDVEVDLFDNLHALGLYIYILRQNEVNIKKIARKFGISKNQITIFVEGLIDLGVLKMKGKSGVSCE